MKTRCFAWFPLAVVSATLVAGACGGNVVVDDSSSIDAGPCPAIAAACAAFCANPACATGAWSPTCLDGCMRVYCLGHGCETEIVDALNCEGASAGCPVPFYSGGPCIPQSNAMILCCDANPAACTPPIADAGDASPGG